MLTLSYIFWRMFLSYCSHISCSNAVNFFLQIIFSNRTVYSLSAVNSLAFLSNVNFQTVIAIISYAFHFPLYQLLFYISEIQIHFLRGIAKEQEILSHFIPNLPTVASAYSIWISSFKLSRGKDHTILVLLDYPELQNNVICHPE